MKGIRMIDRPVFRELEPPVEFSRLSPGFYTINCHGRFDAAATESLMQYAALPVAPVLCGSTFLGIMLPFFLHNNNNLMVGVLGNLDLASMLMPDLKKVEPKIADARTATGSVVDYLRDLSGAIPSGDCSFFDGEAVKKCLILLKAACGRSIVSDGLGNMVLSYSAKCLDPRRAASAFLGMAAWAVISMGGSGTVTGSSLEEKLTLEWSRPGNSSQPYLPGSEGASSVLSLAGGLAASSGMALVAENWTENEGMVSLVVKK
jgi:hypothetical protein